MWLLLPDVQRPELPLTLGQEDVHGPVEQMDAQLTLPLQRPVGHHAVKVSSLLIGEHSQPWQKEEDYQNVGREQKQAENPPPPPPTDETTCGNPHVCF